MKNHECETYYPRKEFLMKFLMQLCDTIKRNSFAHRSIFSSVASFASFQAGSAVTQQISLLLFWPENGVCLFNGPVRLRLRPLGGGCSVGDAELARHASDESQEEVWRTGEMTTTRWPRSYWSSYSWAPALGLPPDSWNVDTFSNT